MFRTHDYLRHAFCRTQQVTRHVTATYVGMSIKQKISRFEFAKNLKESCGTKGLFLFNWANWPLFVYFRPIHNTMTNIVLNLKWKKRWWCAWGSNPEPRICKRRWIHCVISTVNMSVNFIVDDWFRTADLWYSNDHFANWATTTAHKLNHFTIIFQVNNCDQLTKPRSVRPNLHTDEPVCPDGQLQCGDGECIDKLLFCDDKPGKVQ